VGWRFFAERLQGDGTAVYLGDIPLTGVTITDALSAPPGLTGKLTPEWATWKLDDDAPLIADWSTAIYAEADDEIRGGGILTNMDYGDDGSLALDCVGFSGYPKNMPYTASMYGVQVDPLDMLRHIWDHLQGQADGNLGVVVDPLTSPIRIGTELEQVEFDTVSGPVSFEAGPYKLAWWQTHDLGKEIDDLAEQTPFDWREVNAWRDDGTIEHRIQLGYPRLGTRRHDLRFAFGENIAVQPSVADEGEDFANEILALGAGEGRDMKRATKANRDGHVRRVRVVTDKSLTSASRLNAAADAELRRSQGMLQVTDLQVRDHLNAELGSWSVGDEIFVQGTTGWRRFDSWCRIIESAISPDAGDVAVLTVLRAEAA
jgi:hypothetical protein